MPIKNVLTLCDQAKLEKIRADLEQHFSTIYRTYALLANKQYKINAELVIKELKNSQFEFLNFADLLVKELRLSTIYDISNIIATDLLPGSNNRTIFIRGLGPALFYQRVLISLLKIEEDIIWGSFTSLHPMMQETLPQFCSEYVRHIKQEEPSLLEFKLAMQRSFDESIDFFANRPKFTNFKKGW